MLRRTHYLVMGQKVELVSGTVKLDPLAIYSWLTVQIW